MINWEFVLYGIVLISVIAFLRGFLGEAIKDIKSFFKNK